MRAFKDQVAHSFSFTALPSLVNTITHNIEVGEGGRSLQGDQVISYALFAQSLPSGHLFQQKIENVQCGLGCSASSSDIQSAVDQFANPDVTSSKAANAAALGRKLKQKTPPPSSVTVTVLNGSGVQGAAANTSYLLAQRGYVTQTPPNGLAANGPAKFHSVIYYDPAQKGVEARRDGVAEPDPARGRRQAAAAARPALARSGLDAARRARQCLPRLGRARSRRRTSRSTSPPSCATTRRPATDLLRPLAHKLKFPLLVPTVLERNSYPDTLPGDKPVRQYWIDRRGGHRAVRLVFHNGNTYWGIQETDWDGAPALTDKSFRHDLGGREFDLYYSGSHLHMVVLRAHGATYWVVNTLLDDLSNETMLAIAKGLKPLTPGK